MTRWAGSRAQDKVALIIKFWSVGISTAELANLISSYTGERVTRNSIVGIYHRTRSNAETKRVANPLAEYPLNQMNDPLVQRASSRKGVKEGRIKPPPGSGNWPRIPHDPPPLPEPEPEPSGIATRDIPLVDIPRKGMCRWPTKRENDEWLYCGLDTEGEGVFCEHHSARAYQNIQPNVDSANKK